MEDVLRGHVAKGFVIAAVVVVVHESSDSHLQITRHFIRDLVHLVLDALMVPLQFPVGLRMVRRRQKEASPDRPSYIASMVHACMLTNDLVECIGHFGKTNLIASLIVAI